MKKAIGETVVKTHAWLEFNKWTDPYKIFKVYYGSIHLLNSNPLPIIN